MWNSTPVFHAHRIVKRLHSQASNGFTEKFHSLGDLTEPRISQGNSAVIAWHAGLRKSARHAEEASKEDLQRCSVRELEGSCFISRVRPKSLTANGSRLELPDARQGSSGCMLQASLIKSPLLIIGSLSG